MLRACFGDPGLFAPREVASVPVLGMAEAAMQEAGERRFSIITGGEIAAAPQAAIATLAAECLAAVERDGAEIVILGGAGLAGLGRPVAEASGVPVIDNIVAAGHRIEAAARSGAFHYPRSEP